MIDDERQRYPRFVKNEVVKLTKEAHRCYIGGRGSPYGIVTAVTMRMGVTVRRINQKTATRYWSGFWRHLRPGEMQKIKASRPSSKVSFCRCSGAGCDRCKGYGWRG